MDYLMVKPKELNDCSIKDKEIVSTFNNQMFLRGYFILRQLKESGDKGQQQRFSKVCKKIREFDVAYRGSAFQKGGYDTLAKQECEKMGYSIDAITARRKEKEAPKDHAKAAANDREPAYQEAVDMFSNAKTVKMS